MLGGGEEWFYRGLGGIDVDLSRSTDERITVHPRMVAGLAWVKCSYDSALGPIRSEWRQGNGTMSMVIAVPPGVTATLILPLKMTPGGPKNGVPKNNLTEMRRDAREIVYRATAGIYHFREAEAP